MPATPTHKWAELSGTALTAALTERSILLLPTGAIEHHGPHLPLMTDALVAEAAAEAMTAAALADGLDVWQLPTLSATKSDEHSWAPGTLWLTASTLLSVVSDLGHAIAATPARKLVFVNGHGGNVALLQVALREIRRRFGLQTFLMSALHMPAGSGDADQPDELGQGIHAGFAETSVVMHLRPDLVHPELFQRNVPEKIAGFEHIGFNAKPVSFGWLSNDFSPTGVIGDPTGASAEAGAKLFDEGIRLALEALHEIHEFALPPREPQG